MQKGVTTPLTNRTALVTTKVGYRPKWSAMLGWVACTYDICIEREMGDPKK